MIGIACPDITNAKLDWYLVQLSVTTVLTERERKKNEWMRLVSRRHNAYQLDSVELLPSNPIDISRCTRKNRCISVVLANANCVRYSRSRDDWIITK